MRARSCAICTYGQKMISCMSNKYLLIKQIRTLSSTIVLRGGHVLILYNCKNKRVKLSIICMPLHESCS